MENRTPLGKQRTWLVTGAAGFIGSHIVDRLIEQGQTVIALDNLSNGNMASVNQKAVFLNMDIHDIAAEASLFKNVDYILHQAAWGSVPRSFEVPEAYQRNNVDGFFKLLEASRKMWNLKKLVFASSSSIFSAVQSPYSLSKKFNEDQAKIWANHFHIPIVGLRYHNVFGPRQNYQSPYAAVIPKWIMLAKNNLPLSLHYDGGQSRDYTFVADVVAANIKAAMSQLRNAEVFNICSGAQTSLNSILKIMGTRFDKIEIQIESTTRARDGAMSSPFDAQKFLGFETRHSFEVALNKTIDWYKECAT
jgi:UDP-N-acetylglucosamine 4-epimerase